MVGYGSSDHFAELYEEIKQLKAENTKLKSMLYEISKICLREFLQK